MRAERNSFVSRLVALAWVRGSVQNPDVRAILQCNSATAGTALLNAERGGYLQRVAGSGRPMRFVLTADRAAAIASMPCQAALRLQAEQLAHIIARVRDVQEAASSGQGQTQRATLGGGYDARASKATARAIQAQAKATAKLVAEAEQRQARALATATRTPTRGQRPPMLPGSQLVVLPPLGRPSTVAIGHQAQIHAHAPVQDPKGLLVRPATPVAGPSPFLLRGGVLGPNDGPYIRPDGLAHQAALSRRGDALVPHQPPRSAL